MNYQIYKLRFLTGVHLGMSSLEDAEYHLFADTLFSAMCIEYLKLYEEGLQGFIEKAQNGSIKISDAFPYIGEELYLHKPIKTITKDENRGNSEIKKAYKKLSYIPISKFETYLKGALDPHLENQRLKQLGYKEIRNQVAIRGETEPQPYRTGIFHFKEGCGLYVILGYEDENDIWMLSEILESIGYSGIGGKRNSGLGKFELLVSKCPQELKSRLMEKNFSCYMSLSVGLPSEDELEVAMDGADYRIVKRSGFVQSDHYSEEQLRKKDLYVFHSGSCFCQKFHGGIYDVGSGGRHPVYRYASPLFMGV